MTPDILCVFGTRPEAIKLAPAVTAFRAAGLSTHVLATGQHTTLLDPVVVRALDITTTLNIASTGNLLRFVAKGHRVLYDFLQAAPPRCVCVQGDTMSALVGALAAHELDIPVAHIEAGVRTHTLSEPWPEELIRVAIDGWSTWRYAPTAHALAALRREGLDGIVTGNTSMDALDATGVRPRSEASPTVLVTLHRRELRTRPDALAILQALCDTTAGLPVSVVWPVHPAMESLVSRLRLPANVSVRPPFAARAMVQAVSEARGVLTDSGGLVEEAAALGVPTAILRTANDRPEAVAAGVAHQFALMPETACVAIGMLATGSLARVPTRVFGDGRAGARIATHLSGALAAC